jgi:hypothetical protein
LDSKFELSDIDKKTISCTAPVKLLLFRFLPNYSLLRSLIQEQYIGTPTLCDVREGDVHVAESFIRMGREIRSRSSVVFTKVGHSLFELITNVTWDVQIFGPIKENQQ